MDDQHEPQSRRRKGSLRKTVLLGVERLRSDRRGPDAATPTTTSPPKPPPPRPQQRPFAFELPSANSSTESYGRPSAEGATSPTSPTGGAYTSNTDDDDTSVGGGLTLAATSSSSAALLPPRRPSASPSPPSSDTSSVLTSGSPPRQRHHAAAAAVAASSPLGASAAPPLPPIEEEWDYADTEWWGWVILAVTWVVFVVGMGSCLEVWSWAWDVGQTPYAPPELEDDPTLPIVGYYPALFVLTAVMSWVWVLVAWVGLKYFKHAKFQGDDT